MCCNYYLQSYCTEKCPSGLMNDSNFVCGELYTVSPCRVNVNSCPLYGTVAVPEGQVKHCCRGPKHVYCIHPWNQSLA